MSSKVNELFMTSSVSEYLTVTARLPSMWRPQPSTDFSFGHHRRTGNQESRLPLVTPYCEDNGRFLQTDGPFRQAPRFFPGHRRY